MKKTLKALLVGAIVSSIVATSFVLPVSAAKINADSSVGNVFEDHRVKSDDNRVAYITMKFDSDPDTVYRGTAFIVAKNALMTVLHAYYNKNLNEFAKEIKVYPEGREAGVVYKVKDVVYDTEVLKNGSIDDGEDWAILEVDEDIGSKYGYFEFSSSVSEGDLITVTGFPGDKGRVRYTEDGEALLVDEKMIRHRISTYSGTSGAPTFKTVDGTDIVVGVYCAGTKDETTNGVNSSTRITESIADLLMKYRQYYYVEYDPNGGTGSMDQTRVDFGINTKLRTNAFTNKNYTFAGWNAYRHSDDKWYYTNPKNTSQSGWYKANAQPSGWKKALYKDGTTVARTSGVKDDTVTMYAQWKKFSVVYKSDGGTGSMSNTTVYYGVATALRNVNFTKAGRHFTGWTSKRLSDNKWYYKDPADTSKTGWYVEGNQPSGWVKYVYNNEQKTARASSVHEDTIEMHATWNSPSTYTVKYLAEGCTGSMASTKVTFGVVTKLSANTFKNGSKKFAGWTAYRQKQRQWYYMNPKDTSQKGWYAQGKQPSGWVKYVYNDRASVAATTGVDGDVVFMYAQWK